MTFDAQWDAFKEKSEIREEKGKGLSFAVLQSHSYLNKNK